MNPLSIKTLSISDEKGTPHDYYKYQILKNQFLNPVELINLQDEWLKNLFIGKYDKETNTFRGNVFEHNNEKYQIKYKEPHFSVVEYGKSNGKNRLYVEGKIEEIIKYLGNLFNKKTYLTNHN